MTIFLLLVITVTDMSDSVLTLLLSFSWFSGLVFDLGLAPFRDSNSWVMLPYTKSSLFSSSALLCRGLFWWSPFTVPYFGYSAFVWTESSD